jgi:hypothetical protein
MPYNLDPQITAGWKPSQITVSLGADGSIQKVTRSLEKYVHEDKALNMDGVITSEMVGGLKVVLSNIILTADVSATHESGYYGNSHRVNSAVNETLTMTVSSGANIKFNIMLSNSKKGYVVEAEQTDGLKDISGSVFYDENGFDITMPKNVSGKDQTYCITVRSIENENISVVVTVTVKSETVPVLPTEPTVPTEPPTKQPEPTA